jgi:UDP-N-acetylmuramoyl-tripeptide--D-alanyl-D-alanine ligase
MRFRASEVAGATGGRLLGPDVELDGASFDSRTLRPGQLFVPIVAERDGHDYIAAAVAAGAPAYLTAIGAVAGLPQATAIAVDDTGAALLRLAAWARDRLMTARVVGITGSVGKTSVKDFVAAIASRDRRTAAAERSYNNEQGLPITILGAPDDTQALVLELGMRGFGEIASLAAVSRPDVGVVTVVAEAHTERVGGIEGVARAKAELVEALPPGGVAVLNADQPLVAAMARRTAARPLTFGATAGDVRAVDVDLDSQARARFTLVTPAGDVEVRLGAPGRHMVTNATAAAAAALAIDVAPDDIAAGLAAAQLSPWRMALERASSGAWVLNDAYNANPTSMTAALEALAALPAQRRIAVLGVMAELHDAPAAHRRIAAQAADLEITLVAVGTDLYGVEPVDDPLVVLGSLASSDAVLVKGSRVAALEHLAARLLTA